VGNKRDAKRKAQHCLISLAHPSFFLGAIACHYEARKGLDSPVCVFNRHMSLYIKWSDRHLRGMWAASVRVIFNAKGNSSGPRRLKWRGQGEVTSAAVGKPCGSGTHCAAPRIGR